MRKLIAAVFFTAIFASFTFISCSKGGGGGSDNTTLTITSSKSSVRADNFEEVSFTVTDQSGTDVTSSCTFKVNNLTYVTNKIHTKTVGNISVYAIRNSSQSNTITVNATDPGPSPFSQKVYVEDFTGAWCGWCPRVGYALAGYNAGHPNAIVVGVHNGDPYTFSLETQLRNQFGVITFPSAIINRDLRWDENTGVLDQKLSERAPLGLSLISSVSGSTINVTAKVKFDVTTNLGMKLILLLVEDGLVYPQSNYMPQFGPDPITNYVHNDVLRRNATNIFGDPIPTASQTIGNTWQADYSFTNVTYNISKCKIVGLVVFDTNGAGYKGALNTQEVTAGQTKNFD
jgi:hypothetical protein